jgi:O-antigen/teichoic acid export membrane protein
MLRNIFIALQGTLIAQGIGFLFMPILTRLYSPAAFGNYQIYMSVLGLLMVITSLRYEMALLSAEKNGEERALLRLSLGLNLTTAVLTLLICAVLVLLHPAWLPLPDFGLWLLVASVLAGGVLQTLGYVLFREQALAVNSWSKILQVTVFCLAALAVAYAGYRQLGLIGADLLGRIAAAALMFAWVFSQRKALLGAATRSMIWNAASQFRRYPQFTTPGGLLTASVGLVSPLVMLFAFGAAFLGQYALVERTILMPAGLIGQSVGQAFTTHLSASFIDGKDAQPEFRRIIAIMTAIGLAPAIILLGFGPSLFGIVFGSQWSQAGQMTGIVAFQLLSSFLMAPVHMTLVVIGRQGLQLTWEVVRLLLVMLVWLVILWQDIKPLQALFLYANAIAATNLLFIFLADRALRNLSNAFAP